MDKGQDWNITWMNMALEIAKKSKDPDTKVGAMLVSPENDQIFSGYNGFARGVVETDERWKRPTKYELVLHAEENAISKKTCSVKGWTIYSTLAPCDHCASLIIQAGINKVFYLDEREAKWTRVIFKECGIQYYDINEVLRQGELDDPSCGARWKNI